MQTRASHLWATCSCCLSIRDLSPAYTMSFLSEMRGFEFSNLKPAQTVIKQYLPPEITIKKVEPGTEIDDSAPDACDWVKHAKKIDAMINKPVEGTFSILR